MVPPCHMKTKPSFWHTSIFHYGLSTVVFIAGLVLTLWVARIFFQKEVTVAQDQFQRTAEQTVAVLGGRLNEYVTLIRGAQALFAASPDVGADQWHEFIGRLRLDRHYPAVISVNYAARVMQQNLRGFLRDVQRTRPDFHLQHIGTQPLHCIIQYEAPARHPSPAVGSDTCNAEKTIDVTYADSGRLGRIMVTDRVEFVTRRRPNRVGVVMAGPVYSRGMSATASGNPVGWIGVALSIHTLMADIVPPGTAVQVFGRGNTSDGAIGTFGAAARKCNSNFYAHCLAVKVPVAVPGGQWVLAFSSDRVWNRLPWWVAVSGFVISLLVALALFLWGRTRIRALRLAQRMTSALRDSEHLLSSITDNIFEGIYRNVPGQGLIYLNKSLVAMFGYNSVEEMRAAQGAILYADPGRRESLRALLEQNGYYRGEEVEYVRRDGSHFFGINNAVAVYDEQGNIVSIDGAISDVTARKAVEDRVRYLAHYDPLTGLENRISFHKRVQREIAQAARSGTRLAVLFLNVDRFKVVNDLLGHSVGDKLLKAVSERIQDLLQEHDAASRQSGDEFLVLLTGVESDEAVGNVAQRLVEVVAGSYSIGQHEIAITPSVGVSFFPEHGDNVETLIKCADAALHHAKASGRHNYQVYAPELSAERQSRAEIEADLHDALQRGELVLHYQPQVELSTRRIVGAEALLRWHHPQKGLIAPDVFIPVAEQSGLIVPIGEWALREACRQNREWQAAGLPIVPVAVNISAVQFHHREIQETILDVLNTSGLDARYLELELTETALMRDISRSAKLFEELRKLGVELVIDDFGTGYSSLSYLRLFKIGKLKIDQSFVRDIGVSDNNAAIVRAIIGLAKNFRARVVAEGVETVSQLAFMRTYECDDVQGYYYSGAVPPEDFAQLLRAGIAQRCARPIDNALQ